MNGQTGFNFAVPARATPSGPPTQVTAATSPPRAPDPSAPPEPPETMFPESVAPVTRPIHYLGSKLRIVRLIREVLDSVSPHDSPVCDLFAGSGTVSRALSKARPVTAVDIQEYSRVICSALLHPNPVPHTQVRALIAAARSSTHAQRLSWAVEPLAHHEQDCLREAHSQHPDHLCALLEQGSLFVSGANLPSLTSPPLRTAMQEAISRLATAGLATGPASLITRYFGGIYFSYLQAAHLDILLEALPQLAPPQRNTLLAAILSTASEIVNTIGKQFAQPLRPRRSDGTPKPNLAHRVSRDRELDVFPLFAHWAARYAAIPAATHQHHVVKMDYAEALEQLPEPVAAVYADPPYTRDHYSRYYHVLETMCLRDCPLVSTVTTNGTTQASRGVYRLERHQSPFCIKSQAPGALRALLTKVRHLGVPLVLSYSSFDKDSAARPRLLALADIESIARQSFHRVEVLTASGVVHNKLTSRANTKETSTPETLIVCRP